MPENSPEQLVFIAYSSEDKQFVDELCSQLGQVPGVKPWIAPEAGRDKELEIKKSLDSARVCIFLASAEAMKDAIIKDLVLPRMIERHKQGKAWFISIEIRPFFHAASKFAFLIEKPMCLISPGLRAQQWSELCAQIDCYLSQVQGVNVPPERVPLLPASSRFLQLPSIPEPGMPDDPPGVPARSRHGRRAKVKRLKSFYIENLTGRRVRFWFLAHDPGKNNEGLDIRPGWNYVDLGTSAKKRYCQMRDQFYSGYIFMIVQDLDVWFESHRTYRSLAGWFEFLRDCSYTVEISRDYFERFRMGETPTRLAIDGRKE